MTPERIQRLRAVLDQRQPDLTLVTDFVHKQRNLSAMVRMCDAVGIMRIHAVLGSAQYQAFRGTAMGSHAWVEVARHEALPEALAPLRGQGMQLLGSDLDSSAIDFRELDYTRPTALVFGAERHGLSEEGRSLVDTCIKIPMVGMVGSLNVSVAAGIILSEAHRQRAAAGFYDRRRMDAKTYQRLLFEWGHPAVRDFCNARGLRYPMLNEEGEIAQPAQWYAQVRAGTAPRREEY